MARTKKTSRPDIKTLKIEQFRASDTLGIALPQLILAIEPDWRTLSQGDARDYQFKPSREWLKIEHQTGGHRCNQRLLIATLLTPKTSEIVKGITELARKWYDSQVGDHRSLDSLIDYRTDLKELLGADCNLSYSKTEKGLYAIDLKFLSHLAVDALPKDLDDLIEFQSGWERAAGSIGRFGLYIMSKNSD